MWPPWNMAESIPPTVKATLLSTQSPRSRTPPTPPSVAMAWQTMTLTTGWRCTRTMQRTQRQRDICNQTQPTWNVATMEYGRINPSNGQGNAPIDTEPTIKNTTHSSIGCNGMANNDAYHGPEMYKNHAKDSTTEGYATRPNQHVMHVAESIPERSRQRS